jgi:hypothetical protein
MTAKKTRVHQPGAEPLRKRFLWAEVTEREQTEIQRYCRKRGMSVSRFLADLTLKDAEDSRHKRKQDVIVRPAIKLTSQQHDKLEVLARLNQKKSVAEFIFDVLEPELEVQRLRAPVRTKMLRYYLSEEEHEVVSNHLMQSGLSAGSYAAMLALRKIRRDSRKPGK